MLLKKTVKIDGLQPQMMVAIGWVAAAYIQFANQPVVLTSALDSHDDRPKSLHLKGLACDFRTRHITQEQAKHIVSFLRVWLDPLGFDTVLEYDHIHTEYDPKPGELLFRREA